MRRADRLFRIVRILRGGRLQTARTLAQKLEVSERRSTAMSAICRRQACPLKARQESGTRCGVILTCLL